MKLFKFEIRTKKKRRELDVLVHAKTPSAAHDHLEKRYAGHEVLNFIELPDDTKHFVIAELDAGD